MKVVLTFVRYCTLNLSTCLAPLIGKKPFNCVLNSSFGQVDDILGEESDNESDGKGKEERMEAEEEEERPHTSKQKATASDHVPPLAAVVEETAQTSTSEDVCVTGNMYRYYSSSAFVLKIPMMNFIIACCIIAPIIRLKNFNDKRDLCD